MQLTQIVTMIICIMIGNFIYNALLKPYTLRWWNRKSQNTIKIIGMDSEKTKQLRDSLEADGWHIEYIEYIEHDEEANHLTATKTTDNPEIPIPTPPVPPTAPSLQRTTDALFGVDLMSKKNDPPHN